MDHYISRVRLRLPEIATSEDIRVKLNNEWHFNFIVYGEQVESNSILEKAPRGRIDNTQKVSEYNYALCESIFSLCPAGAGPNSLRLWESLAIGSIPIILSDSLVLPQVHSDAAVSADLWHEAVIFWPESQVEDLIPYLRTIGTTEQITRAANCRVLFQYINCLTCFETSNTQKQEQRPVPLRSYPCKLLNNEIDHTAILRIFKPQQIQDDKSVAAEFTGISGQAPLSIESAEPEESVVRIVHFDKPEYIRGFNVEVEEGFDIVIIIESSYRYNKFREVSRHVICQMPNSNADSRIYNLQTRGFWAESIRITFKPLSGKRFASPIQINYFEFITSADLYQRAMEMFDNDGILLAASEDASSRHDDLFITVNIDSAVVIDRLHELKEQTDNTLVTPRPLFALQDMPMVNLIGEDIRDGISMYVHLMNRNKNVSRNLANWLELDFDELILLDWSSGVKVATLPDIFDDPRVRVVRVDGQTKFIRTLAQNLATQMCRNQRVFKCDSDVIFAGDFFAEHPLEEGSFWVGEWKQARDHNERHLHGETYYWLEDFRRVGGYDERIKSYGHDDSNLKDRMLLAGIKKQVFNYNFMHHQEHDQKQRAQGAHGLHPMVATYANRLMAAYTPLWSPTSGSSKFTLLDQSTEGRHVTFALESQPLEETCEEHIEEALRIVGSWYINNDSLPAMSATEINNIIWEKQVE
jgi:hypothetical protein